MPLRYLIKQWENCFKSGGPQGWQSSPEKNQEKDTQEAVK
jgi:hypothetical protein